MTDVQSRVAGVRLQTAAFWKQLGVVQFRMFLIALFLQVLVVVPFLVASRRPAADVLLRGGPTRVGTLMHGGGLLLCAAVLIPVHDTLVHAPVDVGIQAPECAVYAALSVDFQLHANGDGGLPQGKSRNLVKTRSGVGTEDKWDYRDAAWFFEDREAAEEGGFEAGHRCGGVKGGGRGVDWGRRCH